MGQPQLRSSERRLESWKEIAAFFGRDERTVRRWEKENALPVRRVPGGAKGRVFAYESELAQWLSAPQAISDAVTTAQPGVEPIVPSSGKVRGMAKLAAAVSLLALLAVGIFVYRGNHRFAVDASAAGSPGRRPATTEAEDFYLKGRYDWNQRTPESLNKAVDDFTQAIVRDPGYAAAYVGLADCYNLQREFGAMPAKEAYPRALAAAQKAVELDPNSPEAHVSLAFASFWGFIRVADAEREFQRALALDPNSAHAHHWHATYLLDIGRFPEAIAEIEQAQKLDPSSTPILADKGLILSMAGQTDQARALLKQIEITAPDFPSAHSYLSELYFVRKEYTPYLEEEETLARLQHDNAALIRLAEERRALASGGPEALLETRLQAGKRLYDQGLRDNFALAADYAAAGVTAQALRYLERSYQNHELELCTLAVNTQFRSMHEDPTFRGLVAKIGLPPLE